MSLIKPPTIPIKWPGSFGTLYEFQLDPIGALYLPIPGVYIFCKQIWDGSWIAQYVGETHDLKNRLSDQLHAHHCLSAVRQQGSTHISTLRVTGGLSDRLRIETDLRHSLKPPCNKQ